MAVTTITSPSAELMEDEVTTFYGSTAVLFKKGVAEIEDISDALLGYFKANGFGVNSKSPKAPEPAPEPFDPTKLENGGVITVGSELRDAAVDPQPEDFLAPTNAGEANPHGPDVVSPGIHANEGVRPVKAGDVTFNGDTDKQSEAEQTHAAAATDGTPVTLTDEERELLGIDEGEPATGAESINTVDAGDPDEPEGPLAPTDEDGNVIPAEELKGQDLTDALEAAGLPTTGKADEKRARLAEYRAAQGE